MAYYCNTNNYQIIHEWGEDSDVGAAPTSLHITKTMHRQDTLHHAYVTLDNTFKEHGAAQFELELSEAYRYESKRAWLAREAHGIRERGTHNKCIVGRSGHQWYDDGEEDQTSHNHERYEHNKAHTRKKDRQWDVNHIY